MAFRSSRIDLLPCVDHLIGTLALSQGGVLINGDIAEPVFVFVLLLSPQDRSVDLLPALQNVVCTMKDKTFRNKLRWATSRGDIWRLLDEAQLASDR